MPSRHDRARADHEYLWNEYAPAEDMTGGHVDQEDLARLLRSPTKATAAAIYDDQIAYWLEKGPDHEERVRGDLDARMISDPRLREIAALYFCGWPPDWLSQSLPPVPRRTFDR